eukprot:UN02458
MIDNDTIFFLHNKTIKLSCLYKKKKIVIHNNKHTQTYTHTFDYTLVILITFPFFPSSIILKHNYNL